jgi:hypothetical protein
MVTWDTWALWCQVPPLPHHCDLAQPPPFASFSLGSVPADLQHFVHGVSVQRTCTLDFKERLPFPIAKCILSHGFIAQRLVKNHRDDFLARSAKRNVTQASELKIWGWRNCG